MGLLHDLSTKYKTLSIVGMAKNAGKTTALNYLIEEAIDEGITLGITSILAIMSAVALATCAVMPLVISLQPLIFGISQLVTALQIGVFFAIGLYKVRKPGSLLIMALMMGLIQLMMSPPMFLSSVLNGVLIELIVLLLLFRGYEKDAAVFVAAMLHTPLSLPFNYLYNRLIKGADSPLAAVADRAPLAAVGMTLAVVAVSALGALIGIKIARELKKSGVLKK